MEYKILLSGDGGQGIQTLSQLICQSAIKSGFNVSHIPNYGLEQRGGVSLAFIKISDKEINYPKFLKADLILILSDQARDRIKNYVNSNNDVLDILDFKQKLLENKISIFSYNVFFLSVIGKKLAGKKILDLKDLFVFLKSKLIKKPNWEQNKQAWDFGQDNK